MLTSTKRIAVLLTAAAVIGGCGPREAGSQRTVQSVAFETVRRQTVTRTVSLVGSVQGYEQATAMSKIVGRVTDIVKPEGSYVNEGEPIAFVVNDIPGMGYKPGPVTAPVSGTVGKVYVEVGQTVAPGVPVASVARYSRRVRVRANVSDQDLRFVRTGARGDISVLAFPDTVFAGTVSRVAPVLDQMSRTATVELTVDNRGRRLIPGMACAVNLVLEQNSDVVALPMTALFTNGVSRIAILDGDTVRLREIKTGLRGDRFVEVTAGIEAGERVITTGKERVAEGDEVKPVEAGQQ